MGARRDKGAKKEQEAKRQAEADAQKGGLRALAKTAGAFVTLATVVGAVSVGLGVYYQTENEAAQETKVSALKRIEAFTAWPGQAQVAAGKGVGLVRRTGWGWALQAQEDIPANTQLLTLPQDVPITVHTAILSRNIRKVMDRNQDAIEAYLSDDVLFHQAVLVVYLLLEARGRGEGRYKAWVDILPETHRNDLYWSAAEMRCLPGIQMRAAERRRGNVDKLLHVATTYFGKDLEGVTADDIRWGYSAVLTRGWWRDHPHHLALYPVVDLTDQRARHYDGPVWRPLPTNAKLTVADNDAVYVISESSIKAGEYVSTSAFSPLLPSDAGPVYGVVDPDFTHALSFLDLSFVSPACEQEKLLVYSNGTAAPQLEACLLQYRSVPDDAPAEEKAKVVRKFLALQADHMLQVWKLDDAGPCNAASIGGKPHGAEVLNLITSHVQVFKHMQNAYGMPSKKKGGR